MCCKLVQDLVKLTEMHIKYDLSEFLGWLLNILNIVPFIFSLKNREGLRNLLAAITV